MKLIEGDKESDIQTQKAAVVLVNDVKHTSTDTNPAVCRVMRSEQKGLRDWRTGGLRVCEG